jgi:hypothetical protein
VPSGKRVIALVWVMPLTVYWKLSAVSPLKRSTRLPTATPGSFAVPAICASGVPVKRNRLPL